MFDVSKWTLGEIAKFEELAGISIRQITGKKVPMGKPMAAMAFVQSRRNGNPITWNDALGLSIEDAEEIIGAGEPKLSTMTKAKLIVWAQENDVDATGTVEELRARCIEAKKAKDSEDAGDDPS